VENMLLFLIVIVLSLLFLTYAYKRIRSWILLSSASREPYLEFLKISKIALLSYCIFLLVLLAQLRYNKNHFEIASVLLLIPILFIAGYMVLVYKKVDGIKLGHQISRIRFILYGLIGIFEVLLIIISWLASLLCWIMGFGHMIND
jgi:hypothetical protein